MTYKEAVRNSFSRYARHYDRYSDIQRICASRLISKIRSGPLGRILDVGCGTGCYTRLLRDKFPHSKIKAVDVSPEMIEVAAEKLKDTGVEFEVIDGEEVRLDEEYDLITSNASFQWFVDLEGALTKYRAALSMGGIILFSAFGPLTFRELQDSVRCLSGTEFSVVSSGFTGRSGLEKILDGIFDDTEVEEMIHRQDHGSVTELLRNIKYTGVRADGIPWKRMWTARALSGLEDIYRRTHKDIIATYQVFFCKGVRR